MAKMFDCGICLDKFIIEDMIREKRRMDIECPYCPEPRLEADDEDGFYEYTSLLDQLVRWCVNCSFGFYVEKNRFRFVECSNCSTLICTDCNEQWESQHEDVTCEQFRQWKVDNDLTRAKVELDRHLKRNGIDCPKCSFRFELSKGGCLHYHCTQCAHDFCGCCKAPFLKSSRCSVSSNCSDTGLHAHHPRNCYYYMRDKEAHELEAILRANSVPFPEDVNIMTTCSVKVQKENGVKLYDEECGQFVFKSKFCEKHYIEHLGYLMFKYNVDPVDNLDLVELRKLLARHNIAHSSQATKLQLVQVVKEKLPIKKSVPTVRQLLGTGNCSQSASYTTPASSSYY